MVLKFLSYNIWFTRHEMSRRMWAIGDLIQHHSPDFIAFQEMTVEHWREFMTGDMSVESGVSQWHTEYQWSPVPPLQAASYFTVLGSRLPFGNGSNLHREAFQDSNMGRDLLWLQTEVPRRATAKGRPLDELASGAQNGIASIPVVFATSHLESLDMVRKREEQAAEVFRMFENVEDAIFCGDTNIGIGEDIPLPEPWRDGWLEFLRRCKVQDSGAQTSKSGGASSGERCDDNGFTFDFSTNEMVYALSSWARVNRARLRYDRFWLRLKNWHVVDFDIVGDEPIQGVAMQMSGVEKSVPVYPSDHYGIVLTLAEGAPPADDADPDPEASGKHGIISFGAAELLLLIVVILLRTGPAVC